METKINKTGNPRLNFLGYMMVLVIVVAICSVFMKRQETLSLLVEDDGLTITMASGYSETVTWSKLLSVEERETLELGTMRDGTDTDKEQSGIWENDEFGTYSLCADATVNRYIVLDTEDGVIVVNYESDSSTHSLYQAIADMLE